MDTRSPSAKAMSLVSSVLTISFMMAIPAGLGFWIDQLLNTVALFMFVGVLFGVSAGTWHLVKLVNFHDDQPKPSTTQQSDIKDGTEDSN